MFKVSRSGVFIVNFEQISHLALVKFEHVNAGRVLTIPVLPWLISATAYAKWRTSFDQKN